MAPPLDVASLPGLLDQRQRSMFDDGLWRESVRQSLYSSAGFDNAALPNSTALFQYARGANVPGAGNASGSPSTLSHTNMEQGGILERPKKFRCDGIRFFMPAIAFGSSNTPGLSDPTMVNNASQDSDLLEDWLILTNSALLFLQIGTKVMVEHPLWFVPGNIGFGGLAAVANDTVSAAAVGNLDISLPHAIGKGLAFHVAPFLIDDSAQTIRCEIRAPLSSAALNDDRLVTVYMSGNYWRGVQ